MPWNFTNLPIKITNLELKLKSYYKGSRRVFGYGKCPSLTGWLQLLVISSQLLKQQQPTKVEETISGGPLTTQPIPLVKNWGDLISQSIILYESSPNPLTSRHNNRLKIIMHNCLQEYHHQQPKGRNP